MANAEVVSMVESISARAQRLQAEANAAAVEHVVQLERALHEAARIGAEIAGGGNVYAAGIRDLAAKASAAADQASVSIAALRERVQS